MNNIDPESAEFLRKKQNPLFPVYELWFHINSSSRNGVINFLIIRLLSGLSCMSHGGVRDKTNSDLNYIPKILSITLYWELSKVTASAVTILENTLH